MKYRYTLYKDGKQYYGYDKIEHVKTHAFVTANLGTVDQYTVHHAHSNGQVTKWPLKEALSVITMPGYFTPYKRKQ